MSIRRLLIALSFLLLTLSAVFGILNNSRIKSARIEQANALAARDAAERARAAQRETTRAPGASSARANPRSAASETRAAKAEADLAKLQNEKAGLQSQLQTKDNEIAQLQKRITEVTTGSATTTGPSVTELQTQLAEARAQLETAEQEKSLISETIGGRRERAPQPPQAPQPSQPAEERMQSRPVVSQPGVRGTILAVNQAYNFVVLNLGGRQGVEANSEMLVVRGTTLIGKIRISSVEPATAIGDIVSSSLPRGVQVQPGDVVIYAGNHS